MPTINSWDGHGFYCELTPVLDPQKKKRWQRKPKPLLYRMCDPLHPGGLQYKNMYRVLWGGPGKLKTIIGPGAEIAITHCYLDPNGTWQILTGGNAISARLAPLTPNTHYTVRFLGQYVVYKAR